SSRSDMKRAAAPRLPCHPGAGRDLDEPAGPSSEPHGCRVKPGMTRLGAFPGPSGVAARDAPALQRGVVGDARVHPALAFGRAFLLPERRLRLEVVHQELAGLEALA